MEYDNENQSSLEDGSIKEYLDEVLKGSITTTGATTFTSTGTAMTGNTYYNTDSNDIWIYDGTTTTPINTTTGTWQGASYPIQIPEATKDELKKIIKNTEVQIEIDGVMKTAKLSDLLETGYLKLKTL